MNNIKKIALATLFITFVFPAIPEGQTAGFEINANSDDVEAKVDTQLRLYEAPLNFGAGFVYSDNEYFVFDISAMLKDSVFIPALTLGLGFEGSVGQAEVDDEDFDLVALGFVIVGEYDFRRDSSNLPISTSVRLSWAPGSLSFADTERYVKFTLSVYAYVVSNAAIVVGYRDIEARFDDDIPGEVKQSDDALFIGCKLVF